MAQTDARPGFRLPWSSDRQATETPDGDPMTNETVANDGAWPSEDASLSSAAPAATAEPTATGASSATTDASATVDPWAAPAAANEPVPATPTPPPSGRKPTKFMADLTKAMATAAEEARGRALGQLQADAKTYIESIHGRSATEAAALRRAADDDVAAVREWSKAEIARIREETETRITDRKGRLETEIEGHAGVIEREIDAVQKTVSAFEADMAAFFERLLAEEDPSRFATMAENLPEPPSFESIVATPDTETPDATTTDTDTAAAEAVEPEATLEAVADEPDVAGTTTTPDVDGDTAPDPDVATADAAPVTGDASPDAPQPTSADGHVHGANDGEVDREAAFAAIQAAAEAAASAEVAADAAARAEAVADVAIEIIGNQETDDEADPRFAALGLSPDYDAAEAEALAAAGSSDEEIPEIGDDALAARLAGLVPGKSKSATDEASTTQVVVVGLVSVASIASFKRHLGRVPGVQSVGVSSGPDGEFVFAVNHGGDVVLRDAIPSLPSFQARVTGSSDGVVHVTAHDPEADA
jgi:hypothetical protein